MHLYTAGICLYLKWNQALSKRALVTQMKLLFSLFALWLYSQIRNQMVEICANTSSHPHILTFNSLEGVNATQTEAYYISHHATV